MTARYLSLAILALVILLPVATADEKKNDPAAEQKKDDKKDVQKAEYTELSKLIQQAVVEKAPKRHEDSSGWGRTIPLPELVRFPRLRRTVIQKGDRAEVPDGIWKRHVVWLDDPAKDIKIQVRELKSIAPQTYQVKLDATVSAHGEGERQRWRNGIRLFGISVQADATITAALVIDVKLSFDSKKFPPEVIVEPKVAESKLLLEKFDLNRVGPVVLGEDARQVGEELKGFLQGLITQHDDDVKKAANEAIAKALKEGKGRISAGSLLNLTKSAKPKDK